MVALLHNQRISPEAEQFIATRPFHRPGLRAIAELLPRDDQELHIWLSRAAAEEQVDNFVFLICAAAMSGRELQVSLLINSLHLFPDDWRFAWIAWHMKGDLMAALLETSAAGIPTSRMAMVHFVAAAWWLEHRPGEPLPNKLLSSVHTLSAWKNVNAETLAIMAAFASLTSGGTMARVGGAKGAAAAEKGRGMAKRIFKILHGSFEELIPERDTREFWGGRTLRRSVERIGRNEPCPCGSGKKYKHCCHGKDQERLRYSSEVAGKTQKEVAQDPTANLTRKRLEKMLGPDIEKLDPARVPVELREEFLLRLGVFERFEALVSAFEKIGVPEALQQTWARVFLFAIWSWRRDIASRLLAAWPEAEATRGQPPVGVRLLLASDDPGNLLNALEAEALRALRSGKIENVEDLAGAFLSSPYKALAILLARGVLPLTTSERASHMFDVILSKRGELDLSQDDEFTDWMNDAALRKALEHETAAVQEAEETLKKRSAEARRVKEERAQLQRQLTLLKKRQRVQQENANETRAQPDEQTQSKLRETSAKLERVQALAREKGEAELKARRELERLTRENEELRAKATADEKSANGGVEAGHEDFQIAGKQPLRPLAFPKDFRLKLATFKPHVGRAAINRLGRIAAGEAAAFEKLKAIVALPGVLEARIADRYRLFFSLLPNCVRVVDLIYRPDLDKTIERYKITGLPPVPEFD